ncbi:MAG TPA: GGDEF domain-containing phosphodiesterase [Steroidobacteraceae bacterium]|jgi:diguanylate cyclase (GGDEF)-like protein|nr:GGDEF domain-containing phosphodiesterase [Steroidobacteraceae bacterium]
MNTHLRRYLPLALGSLLALTLALAMLRTRYQLESARERLHLQTLVTAVGREVDAELARGEGALRSTATHPVGHWHRWRLGAGGYRDAPGEVPPIAESTLRRALQARDLSGGVSVLLGPFAQEQGGNALVLATHDGGAAAWHGTWEPVDALMAQSHVTQMLREGYRLQLFDVTGAGALYQSDAAPLDASAAAPLRAGGSLLELRAAHPAGTGLVGFLTPALLVSLGLVLWISCEWRRGLGLRVAQENLAEAQRRRRDLNVLYGKTLERMTVLESRLQIESMYDGFTGLGNRSALLRRIEAILDAMRQSREGTLTVLAIGFDRVDHITNSFGAQLASRVVVVAAERVQSVLPAKELLYRTADFQLAMALADAQSKDCEALAQAMIGAIQMPILLDSHTFLLHPSIGITATTSGYENAEAQLDHANAALGALPRDAPVRFCRFDSATAKESISRLQLEADLDRAFAENEFVLEYEPFVIPVARSVAGFEALIRWNHPTEGLLYPGRFVPLALQAGLAHRLNTWVMREAARQMAMWRRAGHKDLFINFNLSAEAFLRPQLVEEIAAVLQEFELPGRQLVVELTESTLVQDIRGAAHTLQRLSEMEVGAWLDDFGTGYSSLNHLRSLPLKGVKIDRSFVERIDVDARDFGFLKALIDLVSYLGMQSIVEGIETPSQYELVSLTACDLYQGYYFSRGLSAAAAERWITEAPAGLGGQTLVEKSPIVAPELLRASERRGGS